MTLLKNSQICYFRKMTSYIFTDFFLFLLYAFLTISTKLKVRYNYKYMIWIGGEVILSSSCSNIIASSFKAILSQEITVWQSF